MATAPPSGAVPSLENICCSRLALALSEAQNQNRSFPGLLAGLPHSVVHQLSGLMLPGGKRKHSALSIRPFFVSVGSPLLVELAIANVSPLDLAAITKTHFPLLRSLTIADSAKLKDLAVARFPDTLECISFESCSRIDAAAIASACVNISSLKIAHCSMVDLSCLDLYSHTRKEFKGVHCLSPFSFPLTEAGAFSMLSSLALQRLSDADVERIVAAAPLLVHVDVSFSTQITLVGLGLLMHHLHRVETVVCAHSLTLNSADNEETALQLAALGGHTSSLRVLDLTGSENFTWAACLLPHFLGPELKRLVMDSCNLSCDLFVLLDRFSQRNFAIELSIARNPFQFDGARTKSNDVFRELNLSSIGMRSFAAIGLNTSSTLSRLFADGNPLTPDDLADVLCSLVSAGHPLSSLSLRRCWKLDDATLLRAMDSFDRVYGGNVKICTLDVSHCSELTLKGSVNHWRARFPLCQVVAEGVKAGCENSDDDDDDEQKEEEEEEEGYVVYHSDSNPEWRAMTSFVESVEVLNGHVDDSPVSTTGRSGSAVKSSASTGAPREWSCYCCRCFICARMNLDIVCEKQRYSRAALESMRPLQGQIPLR